MFCFIVDFIENSSAMNLLDKLPRVHEQEHGERPPARRTEGVRGIPPPWAHAATMLPNDLFVLLSCTAPRPHPCQPLALSDLGFCFAVWFSPSLTKGCPSVVGTQSAWFLRRVSIPLARDGPAGFLFCELPAVPLLTCLVVFLS